MLTYTYFFVFYFYYFMKIIRWDIDNVYGK